MRSLASALGAGVRRCCDERDAGAGAAAAATQAPCRFVMGAACCLCRVAAPRERPPREQPARARAADSGPVLRPRGVTDH